MTGYRYGAAGAQARDLMERRALLARDLQLEISRLSRALGAARDATREMGREVRAAGEVTARLRAARLAAERELAALGGLVGVESDTSEVQQERRDALDADQADRARRRRAVS